MKDAICPECGGPKDRRAERCRSCADIQRRAQGEKRFWSLIDKRGPDDCWPWLGFILPRGHGMYSRHHVHRRVYEAIVGPIPAGIFVCHHCDNRACCNPKHLFLGTAKDNTQDMLNKGRCNPPRGTKNGHAKLSEEDVLAIRARYPQGGISQRTLGKEYGVSRGTIRAVLNRRSWAWLKGEA